MNVLKQMIVMAVAFSCATASAMNTSKEDKDKIEYLRYRALTLDEKIAERITELKKERSSQVKENEEQLSKLSREIVMLEALIRPQAKL